MKKVNIKRMIIVFFLSLLSFQVIVPPATVIYASEISEEKNN